MITMGLPDSRVFEAVVFVDQGRARSRGCGCIGARRLNIDPPWPARTLATRQATYWSRSRGPQWRKARRRATVREICNHNCDFEVRTPLDQRPSSEQLPVATDVVPSTPKTWSPTFSNSCMSRPTLTNCRRSRPKFPGRADSGRADSRRLTDIVDSSGLRSVGDLHEPVHRSRRGRRRGRTHRMAARARVLGKPSPNRGRAVQRIAV
jgi:hypothetical protein